MTMMKSTLCQAGFSSVLLLTLMLLMAGMANAQRATGVINGRVVTEDGQPVRHASVMVFGMSGVRRIVGGMSTIVTDEEGNFQINGLDPMPYQVTANAPGYVTLPNNKIVDPANPRPASYVYVGESVTVTMVRGGIITGKVLTASGDPVIAAAVKVERVRDEAGRPTQGQNQNSGAPRQTDDRGVYRIYGLLPGAYIVSVGTGRGFSTRANPYENRLPVYYPSAARDTATEVAVRSGEETAGVDIRYRAERGFAISGKVLGAPVEARSGMIINTSSILLRQASTGLLVNTTFISLMSEQNGYAFYGVPNGEYELVASRTPQGDEASLASQPRRVTVNGRDVSGIDLTMSALGSLAGTVAIEKSAGKRESSGQAAPAQPADEQKCESKRESYVTEVVITARRDDPNEKESLPTTTLGDLSNGVPTDQGAFTLRGLKAGRYRLSVQLPDEQWYLKSVGAGGVTGTPQGAQNPAAAASEIVRDGVAIKAGERFSGVKVIVASGAASLKGKLTTGPDVKDAKGAKLPARLRVFLLPAEAEAKDDLLRFAEVKAEDNGTFSFANLAPGKYLLVARAIPDAESAEKPPKPVAWNAVERAKLRKDAETANAAIELKSCQRVADFTLRFTK